MKRHGRTVFLWFLLLIFAVGAAGTAQARKRNHKKTKTVPQRPQQELSLGEVTIFGENTTVRLPRRKLIPDEPPQVPRLLTWRTFQLIPPSELKAPELPSAPSSEVNQIVRLKLFGGSARTGNGGLLLWKNQGRWQTGVAARWANTLGTHTNRFRHSGTAAFWGAFHLNSTRQATFELGFLQNSLGFGLIPGFLRGTFPSWRKARALHYQVGFHSFGAPLTWAAFYRARLFPLTNPLNFYSQTACTASKSGLEEKTQEFQVQAQYSGAATFRFNTQLILNRDQIPAVAIPSSGTPGFSFQNSQTFLETNLTVSKRLTPRFLGELTLNAFYFSPKGGDTFFKTKPASRLLFSPAANLHIFASYFAGYRFQTLYTLYEKNPFFQTTADLSRLEFQKAHAQVGANWNTGAGLTLAVRFSENQIQNYPAWARHHYLGAGNWGTCKPGLFDLTYLPEVHFQELRVQVQLGTTPGRYLRLTLTPRFNKTSTIDSTAGNQLFVTDNIPQLPNFEFGAEGAVSFGPNWRLNWRSLYKSGRLVESFYNSANSLPVVSNPYLSEFWLVNVRASYHLPFGSLFGGVWNLLDQSIEPFDGMWADGRKFFGGVTIQF